MAEDLFLGKDAQDVSSPAYKDDVDNFLTFLWMMHTPMEERRLLRESGASLSDVLVAWENANPEVIGIWTNRIVDRLTPILKKHRESILRIAVALFKQQQLSGDEVRKLMSEDDTAALGGSE